MFGKYFVKTLHVLQLVKPVLTFSPRRPWETTCSCSSLDACSRYSGTVYIFCPETSRRWNMRTVFRTKNMQLRHCFINMRFSYRLDKHVGKYPTRNKHAVKQLVKLRTCHNLWGLIFCTLYVPYQNPFDRHKMRTHCWKPFPMGRNTDVPFARSRLIWIVHLY